MAAFECLIVMEKGIIPCIENDDQHLWPELRRVQTTEIVVDSVPLDEANDKIMELAKEEMGWTEDDPHPFSFYERANAYQHSDVYVTGWLPNNKRVYRRFYWVLKSTDCIIEKRLGE